MKIGLCGLGRAGKAMAIKIINSKENDLVCVICRDSSEKVGKEVGSLLQIAPIGINVIGMSDFERSEQKDIDVIIDFSNYFFSIDLLRVCEKKGINLVICTTGFSEENLKEIVETGLRKKIGVLYAPTLTLGINLLINIVSELSKQIPWFDFAIVERHCKDKKRVTTTAKIISQALKRDDVHISSVRAGGYVGIHEVTAASEEERITIIHESFSRGAFANGALMAAEYIKNKTGFYEMKDVVEALSTMEKG